MRIGLVAMEGCFGVGVVSMLDLLQTAEALREEVEPVDPGHRGGGRGRAGAGGHELGRRRARHRRIRRSRDVDVSVVCALKTFTTDETVSALERPDLRGLMRAVTDVAGRGAGLAAACAGSFALAEAGILDGGRATTSWWLGRDFAAATRRLLDLTRWS